MDLLEVVEINLRGIINPFVSAMVEGQDVNVRKLTEMLVDHVSVSVWIQMFI